jgi:hypothetical protein
MSGRGPASVLAMKRFLTAMVLVLGSSLAVAQEPLANPFTFAVPTGFVNLSPGQPEANWQGFNPQVRALVKNGNFAFYASEKTAGDDGFTENVNITLAPTEKPITEAWLTGFAGMMDGELKRSTNGQAGFAPLASKVVKIGGVPSGRIVGITKLPGAEIKQIFYIIPSGKVTAIVTYSTTEKSFAKYEPIFDAAAQKTKGAKP